MTILIGASSNGVQPTELTITFDCVVRHDTGEITERLTYRPTAVFQRAPMVPVRNEDGSQRMTPVRDDDGNVVYEDDGVTPRQSPMMRQENIPERLDRLCPTLPFQDGDGNPMTAVQVYEADAGWLWLLKEFLHQIEVHADPKARMLTSTLRG